MKKRPGIGSIIIAVGGIIVLFYLFVLVTAWL